MSDQQAVSLEELQGWIGREHPFVGADDVTRGDIRRKLEAYCLDCPLHYDDAVARAHGYRGLVAPVAMTPLWAMPAYWQPGEPVLFRPGVREQSGGIKTDLPVTYRGGVNAASEWEYFEPLYPGDALYGNWRLIEIKPHETRLGEGVLLTVETTMFKRPGELVAKNRNTHYRFTPKAPGARREKTGEPKSGPTGAEVSETAIATSEPADWSRQLRFAEVAAGAEVPAYSMWLSYQRIVMSVAADRMFSGLHHNREEARSRGYDDVIFNTRGYEMMFETLLRRWMGLDGRLVTLGPFRMTGASYPGDVVTTRACVLDTTQDPGRGLVKLEVFATNNRGEAARGEARVALPQ